MNGEEGRREGGKLQAYSRPGHPVALVSVLGQDVYLTQGFFFPGANLYGSEWKKNFFFFFCEDQGIH